MKKESTLKALKPFEIAFVGLSGGKHEFTFVLNNDFFACFESNDQLIVANLEGKMVMDKGTNRLDLDFYITGKIELVCDRCLEPFWYQLDLHDILYVKFGERKEEQSDDVVVIPSTDSHIDVSQYFYEFVMLGLPLKKVHEDDENGVPGCNPRVLEELEKYVFKRNNDLTKNDENKPSDSRWDALKNIKFN